MSETKRSTTYVAVENVNLYSILSDVVKNLWVILLGTLAVGMVVNLMASAGYEKTYTTSATFVVSTRSSSTSVYNNLSAAQTMASNFSNILNSDVLKKQVCRDLDMETFDAKASAAVIAETNLLTLTVTAETPKKAYEVIRSIMNNYSHITQYVTTDMIMQVLQNPEVPTGVDVVRSARRVARKWEALAFAGLVCLFAALSFLKNTVKSEKDLKEKIAAKPMGVTYYEYNGILARKRKALIVNNVAASFDYVERFKKLGSKLTHITDKLQAKSIVITSVDKKEGKSNLAVNLALTLTKQGKKVLLIDGNLRSPSLYKLLHVTVKQSDTLEAYLNGNAPLKQVLKYDPKSGLYLALGLYSCKNASELLAKPDLGKMIRAMQDKVDYILIDTPAMKGSADSEAIAAQADMVVMAVQYDRVSAEDINDAIDALQSGKSIPLYTVLTMTHTLPGERNATVGYGNYGRYGRYGHYGKYGHYGHYGSYGHYGHYGNYGHYSQDQDEQQDSRHKERRLSLKETLGTAEGQGGETE